MAAMLAAVLLGAAAHVAGDAITGVIAARKALAAQQSINFTRSNESEADRVGMDVLSSAGFDPNGMASFFERSGSATARWKRMCRRSSRATPCHKRAHRRSALARAAAAAHEACRQRGVWLAKARLEVLSAPTPEAAYSLFKTAATATTPRTATASRSRQMRLSLNDNAERRSRSRRWRIRPSMAYRDRPGRGAMAASGATGAALQAL